MSWMCETLTCKIDWKETDEVNTLAFPPFTRAFALQTAGHVFGEGKSKAGILLHDDLSLLKLVLDPVRAKREQSFYQRVFDDSCRDPVIRNLRSFIPRYLGDFTTHIGEQDVTFLKLENLTLKFQKPSLMDVKIGFITYDPEASKDKIMRSKDKYISTRTNGFCIPGMKVYDKRSQEYQVYEKSYGKQLTDKTIKEALITFLGGKTNIEGRIIASFLDQLNHIKKWFLMQQHFAFYSSSLLFIYESEITSDSKELMHLSNGDSAIISSRNGTILRDFHDMGFQTNHSNKHEIIKDASKRCRTNSFEFLHGLSAQKSNGLSNKSVDELETASGEKLNPLTEVKMIDFAHVFPATEIDENYLTGLNNLIEIFEEIRNEQKQTKFSTL